MKRGIDHNEISNGEWAKVGKEGWVRMFEIRAGRKQGKRKRIKEEMSGLCGQVMF